MLLVLLVGCTRGQPPVQPIPKPAPNVPPYSAETFRDDVTKLITERRYDEAVAYLIAADPIRQAIYDKSGYYAVAEDLIVLPGVYPDIHYDRGRDWEFPGTSNAVVC